MLFKNKTKEKEEKDKENCKYLLDCVEERGRVESLSELASELGDKVHAAIRGAYGLFWKSQGDCYTAVLVPVGDVSVRFEDGNRLCHMPAVCRLSPQCPRY